MALSRSKLTAIASTPAIRRSGVELQSAVRLQECTLTHVLNFRVSERHIVLSTARYLTRHRKEI